MEASLSTLAGFVLAWLTNLIVLPWFGFEVSADQASYIALIFTAVSVVRGYLIRRLFERLH